MPETPLGVYYPSGASPVDVAGDLAKLADSLNGRLFISVPSATAANTLRDLIEPTSDRPLIVWRSDVSQLWYSVGGEFQPVFGQPSRGFALWGKPASQTLTGTAANLVGWTERSAVGTMPADAESDGSFQILQDGWYDVSVHVALNTTTAAQAAGANAQLRVEADGSSIAQTYVSLAFPGVRTLQVNATQAFNAGNLLTARVLVSGLLSGDQTPSTYPSVYWTWLAISKLG